MNRPVCRADDYIRGLWKGSIRVVIEFCVHETHQSFLLRYNVKISDRIMSTIPYNANTWAYLYFQTYKQHDNSHHIYLFVWYISMVLTSTMG